MRRLAPALVVLAIAAGCGSPDRRPIDPSLYQAPVEVTGMT